MGRLSLAEREFSDKLKQRDFLGSYVSSGRPIVFPERCNLEGR
jgi:hypothetical protein